jgi:hypothetical protein
VESNNRLVILTSKSNLPILQLYLTKVFEATVTSEMVAVGLQVAEMNPELKGFFHGLYSWSVDYFCAHTNKETNLEKDTDILNCGIVREKLIRWIAKTKILLTKSPNESRPKGFHKGNGSAINQANFRKSLRSKGRHQVCLT